jgi:hypothetical protein
MDSARYSGELVKSSRAHDLHDRFAKLLDRWNQVSLQQSTEKIPEKILPTLDKLYDEFRSLGASLNAKIERLQNSVLAQDDHVGSELTSMTNLRECVRAAADVVSTASSTLTVENVDKESVKYGSEFGDIFTHNTNETMMRWMSSNAVNSPPGSTISIEEDDVMLQFDDDAANERLKREASLRALFQKNTNEKLGTPNGYRKVEALLIRWDESIDDFPGHSEEVTSRQAA